MDVLRIATAVLIQIGDTYAISRAIDPLVSRCNRSPQLGDSHPKAYIRLLSQFGSAAVESLVVLLEHSENTFEIIQALGEIKDGRAVDALIVRLKDDKYPGIQAEAAKALAMIGGTQAVNALIAALSSRNESLRKDVVTTLDQIGDVNVIDALSKSLNDQYEDEGVRKAAANALGRIKHPRAVNALLPCLNDKSLYVRLHAAASLIKLNISLPQSDISNLILEFVEKRVEQDTGDTVRILAAELNMSYKLVSAAQIAIGRPPIRYSKAFDSDYLAEEYLDMASGLTAVKMLCSTSNGFTSSVLKLVAKRENEIINLHREFSTNAQETADFSEWRQLARRELAQRGIQA